jgi:predicted Fe-S protein YdhL (DUF1289 family)
MTTVPTSALTSPCVNICRIDPATGWCRGCARDIDEITGWGGKPEAVQREILARLPQRRARLQQLGQWLAPATPPEERLP